MAKEDTGDTPSKETPKEVDYEKRYKDAQAELTKKSQELSDTKKEYARDKELLDTVTPYIDWKAVNGETKSEDDGEMVSKKELNAKFEELKKAQNVAQVTMDFRRKYPDMIDYADQVGFYLQNKTDPRSKMSDRIENAVEYTKKFLDTERAKGVSSSQEQKAEAKKKEAEASGLTEKGQKKAKPPDSEGETNEDYLAWRKGQTNKPWAPDPSLRK